MSDAVYWRNRTRYHATRAGIDPDLFERQIDAESDFDPNVRPSSAGAIGIAQIVPRWHPNVDPRNPESSLAYAARWIKQLLAKYGNWRDALSVYNSGRPWSEGQRFDETRDYVNRILGGSAGTMNGTQSRTTDYAFAEACFQNGFKSYGDLITCTAARIAQRDGLRQNDSRVLGKARVAAARVQVNYGNQVQTGAIASVRSALPFGGEEGDVNLFNATGKAVVEPFEFWQNVIGKLMDWHTWLRIVEVIAGGIAIFYGVKILATGQIPSPPNPLRR